MGRHARIEKVNTVCIQRLRDTARSGVEKAEKHQMKLDIEKQADMSH